MGVFFYFPFLDFISWSRGPGPKPNHFHPRSSLSLLSNTWNLREFQQFIFLFGVVRYYSFIYYTWDYDSLTASLHRCLSTTLKGYRVLPRKVFHSMKCEFLKTYRYHAHLEYHLSGKLAISNKSLCFHRTGKLQWPLFYPWRRQLSGKISQNEAFAGFNNFLCAWIDTAISQIKKIPINFLYHKFLDKSYPGHHTNSFPDYSPGQRSFILFWSQQETSFEKEARCSRYVSHGRFTPANPWKGEASSGRSQMKVAYRKVPYCIEQSTASKTFVKVRS